VVMKIIPEHMDEVDCVIPSCSVRVSRKQHWKKKNTLVVNPQSCAIFNIVDVLFSEARRAPPPRLASKMGINK